LRERSATPPWEELADDAANPRRQLKEAIGGLAVATMQVGRAGSQAQTQRVLDLLNDTRKKIYGILAEGE
jgi:hypothetical protein